MSKREVSDTNVEIDEYVSFLVRDSVFQAKFKKAYPDTWQTRVQQIAAGQSVNAGEYNLLLNTLFNDGRLHLRYSAGESAAERFHIDVRGLGGVYFLFADEYGHWGYLTDLEAASDFVEGNWNTNLQSYTPRRFRPAFGQQQTTVRQQDSRPAGSAAATLTQSIQEMAGHQHLVAREERWWRRRESNWIGGCGRCPMTGGFWPDSANSLRASPTLRS